MPLGNPIRKQNESRMVSVLATEGQTVFTVQGGYIINQISVFRNGVRLSNSEDFTAGDGSTVTLNNAANIDDRIEFHIFDRFTVQNAIIGAASTQTINGDLVLNGKLFGQLDVPSINLTGIITATELDLNGKGDISSDLNVVGVTTVGKQVHVGTGVSIAAGGLNVTAGITTVQALQATTGIITGTAAQLELVGNEGISAALRLTADQGDDNGDGWEIRSNQDDNDLTISNNTTGSYVDKFTLLKTGELTLTSDLTIPDKIVHTGDTDTKIRFPTDNEVSIETAGSERLRITSGGIVQIGGAPENSADIDTSNTKLIIKQSGGAQEDGIYMERSGERRGHYIYVGGALDQNDALCVTTNQLGGDTDLLAIDRAGDVIIGAGNLGIHSTSPDRRFTLFSNATTRMNLKSLADSTVGIEFGDPADHNIGFIVYDNTNDSMQFGVNAGERLRINSSGDVGVDINAPVARFQVNSTRNAETDRHSSANYHLALRNPEDDNGESIGLSFGITSNATKVGAAILHERDGGGSQGSLQFHTSSDGNSLTERMRVQANGRVNIGVNPQNAAQALLNLKGNLDDGNQTVLLRLGNDSSGSGTGAAMVMGAGAGASSQGVTLAGFYDGTGTSFTVGTNASFNGSTTERLRIGPDGLLTLNGGADFNVAGGEADIYSTGSGTQYSFRLLNSDATAGNRIGIYFGPANNVAGAYIRGHASEDFTSTAARDCGLEFGVRHNGTFYEALDINSMGQQDNVSVTNASDHFKFRNTTTSNTGNMLVLVSSRNTTNNSYKLAHWGSTSATRFSVTDGGTVQTTNNSYGALSDQTLKENIVDAGSQWDDIKNLKVRKFNFIETTDPDKKTMLGVVAQEAETVCPNLVEISKMTQNGEENEFKTFKYSVLYMKSVKALQEAMTRIETLEARIAALEGS